MVPHSAAAASTGNFDTLNADQNLTNLLRYCEEPAQRALLVLTNV
jgi:hypothetical protein